VEILSPNNTRAEIDERLKDFFASGTQIAWIINPDQECVEVCHSPTQRKLLGSGADLDGEHLLPGFRYSVTDLFKSGLGVAADGEMPAASSSSRKALLY